MPSRMLEYDPLWASDKIANAEASTRPEYTWLYGLADGHGCFELNLRAIWSKVSAIRPELTQDRLRAIFAEFERVGLLFVWVANGKRYAYWTGSDRPGRLPKLSERSRYKRSTPPIPPAELVAYEAKFRSQGLNAENRDSIASTSREDRDSIATTSRPELDLDLNLIGSGSGSEKDRGRNGEGGGVEEETQTAKALTEDTRPPKAFVCRRCGADFVDVQQYNNHMRAHLAEIETPAGKRRRRVTF